MTLYHLKHSLASAAQQASGGLVDRHGVLRIAPGVQRALDHAHARTTRIYTQIAVDPMVRQVSASLSIFLADLFAHPLTAPAALRLVPFATG
jgi:hypothetical protein